MKKFYELSILATFFCSAFVTLSVVEGFAQSLNFTATPTSGCVPHTVTFTNTTTDPNAYRYIWYWGDGNWEIDTLTTTISHTYTMSGNYSPNVDVYDISNNYIGWTYGSSGNISVQGAGNFYIANDTVCPNDVIYFNADNGNSWNWDFGDGNSSTQQNPAHSYTATGTYTVTLNMNDQCGNHTFTQTITAVNNLYPTAYINFYPYKVCPGEPIGFNPSYGGYSAYFWDFGDGNTSTQATNLSHSYAATGTYTVMLVVTNGCGNTDTAYATDTVANGLGFPGGVNIYNNYGDVCPTQQANLYATGDTYPKYVWNLGDGSPLDSSGRNLYHSYTTAGTKTVTCTITNFCGIDSVFTTTVNVVSYLPFPNQPWFNLQVNTSPACPNSDINFYAPGNFGDNYFYIWNFGDGSPMDSAANLNNVNHTYGPVGTYTSSVKIRNACGNDTTLYGIVDINATAPFPNNISLNINPNPSCPGDVVVLNAPYGFQNYQYIFGDGSPNFNGPYSGKEHQYATVGTYTASVIVTNSCGNDTTLTAIVNIINNAGFSNLNVNMSNPTPCPGEPVFFDATYGYPKYVWNYGDGSPADSLVGSQGNHTYTATGTYTLSVTITNNCGQDTTLSGSFTINNNVPIPNNLSINTYYTPACPGQSIQFNGPGGAFVSYKWNMGDGFIDSVSNSTYIYHSYSVAGTYTVSLIIENYCGNKDTLYSTVVITNTLGFPNNNFNLQISPPSACPGQYVNIWAPGGYASYVWDFGDGITDSIPYSGVNHTYMTVGTYSVSVKIYSFCGNDTTLYGTLTIGTNIGFTEQLNFDVNPSPSCPGDEVNFNASGGYASYVYNFGDGNTAAGNSYTGHTYTATGTYTVSVTITNQCGIDTTLTEAVAIDSSGIFPNWVSIYSYPSSSCPGDKVNFDVQGQYQSYLWIFGDGDSLFTTSKDNVQHTYAATGVYSVACIMTNGCGSTKTFYTTVQITTNSPIGNISMNTLNAPACPGDNVVIIVESGSSTYTYCWDYGDGTLDTTIGGNGTHAYTSVGNYTVTLTAINGCGNSKTVTINISIINNAYPILVTPEGEQMWGTPGGDNGNTFAGCPGDAILFYFMGSAANNVWNFGDGNTGTATQQMILNGGGGDFPLTIINHAYAVAGTYTVTLTLTNSCGNSTTDTITVVVGGNLLVNGDLMTSPPPFTTCASMDFLAFGGQTYEYDFGDGSPNVTTSSPMISHMYPTAGVYVAACLITNGCGNTATYYQTINVITGGGPSVTVLSNITPTCVGGSDGIIDVTASNGTAPYAYLWNDASAQTTSMATGLAAGNYAVIVTDNVGCASIQYLTVNNPAAIVLASSATQAGCGQSDGTGAVSVTSGGTSPYSYLWGDGQTTSTATGFMWGSYAVTVTDANGCTSTTNVSVSEAGAATVTTNSVTNTTCYNGANGVIDINVTGGNPPYTYSWSNGGTTEDISGLTAGNYSVVITDAGSCMAILNATVGQGTQIIVSTNVVQAPTCGNLDGSASANVTGGTAPYSYSWTNSGGQTTQTATGLGAGTRTVTVTDANGCISTGIISLSNANSPMIASTVVNVSCNGAADGTIDLNISGGTSPFLFTWSTNVGGPQINNEDVNSLAPGNYIVTVQDAANCFSFNNYTIIEPAVLSSTAVSTGATCGSNNGTATASPVGGTAPFTYAWTGGQTSQTAINLALGNYTVTVTDSKGCTTSATTTVTATTNTQAICVVTVDSTSTKNVIWWEKPLNAPIDSFRIYRDISSVYTYVGAVSYNSLSTFTDSTAGVDPNLTSYRYKISVLDTCGMESDTSAYHKTMLLQVSPAIPSGYNLDWDDYLGMTVTEYKILRDTTGTGNFWQAIDSVGFAITSYTDPIPWDTVSYVIETDHPTGCTATVKNPLPMASNLNSSRSNIYRIADSTATGIHTMNGESMISIYPNPSSGIFTIEVKEKNTSVKIFNMLGDEVRGINTISNKEKISVDISRYAKGMYYVRALNGKNTVTRKIVIE